MELAVVPPLHRPLRPEGQPDPLRDDLAMQIEASALDLLDPARLEALAEDLGVMQRQRMHPIGLVSCALIVSALQRSTDTQGRLLDAQRTYEAMGGPEGGLGGQPQRLPLPSPQKRRGAADRAEPAAASDGGADERRGAAWATVDLPRCHHPRRLRI
jgi:hypothetical protein